MGCLTGALDNNVIFVDLDSTLVDSYDHHVRDYSALVRDAMHDPSPWAARRLARYMLLEQQELGARPLSSLGGAWRVIVRPGAFEALEAFAGMGEVHLFTGAEAGYAADVLRVTGLPIPGKIFSLREPVDFTWVRGRPWVLVDDSSTHYKLHALGASDFNRHVVVVDDFSRGTTATPLTHYVPEVHRKLAAQV